MKNEKFRDILFNTAVFAMACDGEIHENEIEELKKIALKTSYFEGTNFDHLLDKLVKRIKKKGRDSVKEYFNLISGKEFSSSEELLILEVALRIINADEKIDQNEERFIRVLRRSLQVSDEILKLRFGNVGPIMAIKDGAIEEAKRIIPANVLSAIDDINLTSSDTEKLEE